MIEAKLFLGALPMMMLKGGMRNTFADFVRMYVREVALGPL
jgi:hypothetical protein